jgi:ppGpp synthetase/RelA/SpoT-type nucleotidyltranferase
VSDLFEFTKLNRPVSPWGSKGLVNRAGESLREGRQLSKEELDALENWRAAHKHVLNTFQAILRNRTKSAKRLKRRPTIVDKLFREPKMQLARMDDVAGCRLIFENTKELNKFRQQFHKARFKHKRKNEPDKYDYLKHPKGSGYRGVHDIYEYDASSKKGKVFRGLLLELQCRTLPQHAWATAVELVSRVTENQPKFSRGDERVMEFFRLASEITARAHEGTKSVYADLSNEELLQRIETLEKEIHLVRILKGLHTIYEGRPDGGNTILQFKQDGVLNIHDADSDKAAVQLYFDLEKANPKDDIVLVNADTFEEIRSAYRNYFSDPREFLRYLHEGCVALGGKGFN